MHSLLATLAAAAIGFAPANHASRQQVADKSISKTSAARVRLSTLETQLLGQINSTRARRGLRTLRLSAKLSAAANQHSVSMAEKGYFSHNSANGGSFFKRIAYFYPYKGYSSWSAGENLLWSSPDVSPAGALRMWMNSPEHRANLLDRSWREIGLSAVHETNAPGVYGGDEVTIVTADFGCRY
ncbi:MAG TPA: CAP domain-containing protein [Gaiellaceae bacterium]|nr:CAP domain-containing protein [Gaiellaceae bacterium]